MRIGSKSFRILGLTALVAMLQSAFTIAQKQIADTIAGEMKSPGYLARLALLEALYPKNDPALRRPTPASISSLKLEDVKA
jgi:zinc protease